MTKCNQCGGILVPDHTALVPALGCQDCGRLIPRTAVKPVPKLASERRRDLNRALRHARRQERRTP